MHELGRLAEFVGEGLALVVGHVGDDDLEARLHVRPDGVLAEARAALPDGASAEASVARGESIEDAVADLDWQPGELVLVGSSRLAQPRRLFLGSTAAKMLRELPVPMIVVPRTRAQEGAQR